MKEPIAESTVGPVGWLQDQLYQLKGQVAQLEQELAHLRSTASTLTEGARASESSLHEALSRSAQVPRLQEEINQAAALIVHLQDQQQQSQERLAQLARRREEEVGHSHQDWTEAVRRIDQIEREVAAWQDRQEGVDQVGRRFQEDVSLLRVAIQRIEQRLDSTEGRAARSLESANRAEYTLTQVDAAILALQREDESIAERARVGTETAHRLENALNEKVQELDRLELLAERIELHRAERQRLEERALRLEDEQRDLSARAEQGEQEQVRIRGGQQGLASRMDALQEQVEEQRKILLDLLRNLLATEERTRRRRIQELEREIREMKRYAAGLTDQQA